MGRYDKGLSVILIPAFSAAHEAFALHEAEYPGLFDQPLMGWITGVPLDEMGRAAPKVFDGVRGEMHEDGAMLLHVALPGTKMVDLDIINLFKPDTGADEITFANGGFATRKVLINGEERDFAAYLAEKAIDTRCLLTL